ncbi:hypothetical protein ATY79_22185 [Rhizobium sp. R693]|nr:hypothetical protein ATY79_22185 [Rhizobium sp. R693]
MDGGAQELLKALVRARTNFMAAGPITVPGAEGFSPAIGGEKNSYRSIAIFHFAVCLNQEISGFVGLSRSSHSGRLAY